ncbi:serine/threonine-protein kinase [Streptomyces vietnamensis]|uniref:Serine/threonine protein kinase n=1 Tax=Streptomyces vietnamensis TaxID=362257 RepID=A0A0B5IFU7_9ACTN|nr:serine/threonine-protein kinase [Streptomyces vietnamensis]AJF68583.1 serine/threonine protein kinase [Streptomyces vietnamensis]
MSGVPTRIGRYTVARELGSGGMGEVYLAYTPAGDLVAVKVIRNDKLDPLTRARFEKEALIARTVIGTNRVARFLDADPYADRPWLAMEYVAGRTLLACVDSDGLLPLPLVASLGALLAEGLSAVHSAGLLHRDLKPQNVILGDDGPMIIDFGLGAFMDASQETLSHSGMIIGTVRCMPPEQAGGHPQVSPAADVYALGTVLLYAAARHYPYDGSRWEAIAAQVTNAEIAPDLSGVPAPLVPLLESMLAHAPEERPTLQVVSDACARVLSDSGTTPAAARLALIAHTNGGGASSAPGEPLTVSFEKLIHEQADRIEHDEPASPLDDPARVSQAEADESEPDPDEPEVLLPEPAPGSKTRNDPPKPGAARGRPPASKRIADELRALYAADPVL